MRKSGAAIEIVCNKLRNHFKLKSAINSLPTAHSLPSVDGKNWQEKVLNIFNPEHLTLSLKQAPNKHLSFIKLRQIQQTRHNFNLYDLGSLDDKTNAILGIKPTNK